MNWKQLTQDYFNYWKSLQTRHLQKLQETSSYYSIQPPETPKIPPDIILRDYQHQAIYNWIKNKGRGTLKMATGSGKTITALALTYELYQRIGLQVLIVICPYRHLVIQWSKEAQRFNLSPILAFESVHQWQNDLSRQLYQIHNKKQSFLTLITTNSTFITEGLQSQLPYFPEKTLIVGDEAHNLGSPRLEESLPRQIGLRLALSATPERYYDEEGTELIFDYFGKILKPEFTLKDAIEKDALSHYLYHPIFVELTEEEGLSYAKLTQKIGWALQDSDNWKKNDRITALLMQRARLIGCANNKIKALRQLMKNRLNTTHTLFYCGEGNINYPLSQQEIRQLDAVTHLLGIELNYRVNTYTAETPIEERELLKKQFEKGELQGLVAIRCLDEGVDIPIIQTAVILASTGNPRQFIQRRGRILRPHPEKKRAILYDMIVTPPLLDRTAWEVERQLLTKELKRFTEFASLADNSQEALTQFLPLITHYELDIINSF